MSMVPKNTADWLSDAQIFSSRLEGESKRFWTNKAVIPKFLEFSGFIAPGLHQEAMKSTGLAALTKLEPYYIHTKGYITFPQQYH